MTDDYLMHASPAMAYLISFYTRVGILDNIGL